MAVRKLSIALDPVVADAALRAAQSRGMSLSAWLTESARTALHIEDGLRAVAEYEAENGAFTAEGLAEADRILDEAGFPPAP